MGTRTRIAEVLNRKRGLSIAMIRRLHERLGISAEVLIRRTRESCIKNTSPDSASDQAQERLQSAPTACDEWQHAKVDEALRRGAMMEHVKTR
jgi:plasmid maintenance system antidote protein VapI